MATDPSRQVVNTPYYKDSLTGTSAQFWGLLPGFGAFNPVLGPSAKFLGLRSLKGGGGIHTDTHFVCIYLYDSIPTKCEVNYG